MHFDLDLSIQILGRTPKVLDSIIRGLSDEWIYKNEGGDTWTLYDVMGHLIHGEKTDWIPRLEIILSNDPDKTFAPVDRFAQMADKASVPIEDLLNKFTLLRQQNLDKLSALKLTSNELGLHGFHPAFGKVTLSQLLSTWTVHDLDHISQISRILAKQYSEAVGPWIEYLRILK